MTTFEARPSRFKTRGDDHRGTELRVRLTERGLVRFVVYRVAPSCERVGSFVRMGRRGMNRISFSGRVDGRPLTPGTYRIVAQPIGRGRAASESDTVVVVPPDEPVGSAHASPSTCGGGADAVAPTRNSDGGTLVSSGISSGAGSDNDDDQGGQAGLSGQSASSSDSGVAGSRESGPLPGLPGPESVGLLAFLLLYGALGAAFLLLLYAAVRGLRRFRADSAS